MLKRKFGIVVLSVLVVSLLFTGCDSNIGGGSDDFGGIGEISGQITYDNGDVQGTNVILLNENPENTSSYEELSIVEVKTIGNSEGTYLFDDLSSGTYFVAAYKDKNGSGELEFDEFPIEPANVYGEDGVPEAIVVEDSTVTGINIDLSYTGEDYPQYTVEVEVIDPDDGGSPIVGATVVLYGKSGEKIENGPTDLNGLLSFDSIFDGEYYLEVTAGENYKGTILPYYLLRDMDTDEDMSVRFDVPMFTNDFINILYGSGAEDELLLGLLGTAPVADESVSLNPSVSEEDIAYVLMEGTEEMIFDFSSNSFPSEIPSEPGYMLGIKNLSSSVDEYTLSITISGEEEVITFPIKENRLITALDQSDEPL